MANFNNAINLVVNYITSNGLYNFQSLTDETQTQLINAYGAEFEQQVNTRLIL